MQRESKILEFKETLTKTYLKTVSAFSNYNNGEILFGISDDGKVVGIENIEETCLKIENQINDSIKPRPDYIIRVNEDKTISLLIERGESTPYLYNGKAYKRNDTSTIEIGELELKRLVLKGIGKNYEELSSTKKELSFTYLSTLLINKLNLSTFNNDTLKNLNLYSDQEGYNNAAELLADFNSFPGLDIIIYGSNSNEIKKRVTLATKSILEQFFEVMDLFKETYTLEKIENGIRKDIEKVPVNAFREAIANSLIHRTWDIKANNKIEMYTDKIVISSPGGLVEGLTEEQYRKGTFSLLRNPIIANVFYRLGIVEIFATGIKRINESYKNLLEKPYFDIANDAITIELPIVNSIQLTDNENKVFSYMENNVMYTRSVLEEKTKLEKDTLIRTLNSLMNKNLVFKTGKAKATNYYKK